MAGLEGSWRLLQDDAAHGARNMAVDEAILEAVASGEAPPTLRLYSWRPPCLSLGFAQPIDQVERGRLRERGWDLVRRPTGGRAILHTDEITYAVVVSEKLAPVTGDVLATYRFFSEGLVEALRALGVQVEIQPQVDRSNSRREEPVCFEVPSSYEITVHGKKLVGSAQVRRKGTVLQHGTIPLSGDIGRICQVLAFEGERARLSATERVRARAGSVSELLGDGLEWEKAAQALVEGFSRALGVRFERDQLSERETARANELETKRYSDEAWTARR
jgi:lipoate-protein ligase A